MECFSSSRKGAKPAHTSPGNTAKVACFEMLTLNPWHQTFLLEVLQPAGVLHCHCSGKRPHWGLSLKEKKQT